MMTIKMNSSSSYECCMCGDLGLSHELFRCKVCHFRSQHRYCSNLYPKAESYRVCNWCLIQKNDDHETNTTTTTTTTSYNNSSNSNTSSPAATRTKTTPSGANKKHLSNHHPTTTSAGPKSSKCLQPTSPIKKPNSGSPSGRKRIQAQAQAQVQQEERLMRRTKSEEISNGISNSRKSPSSGGPAVIKHVFRNKVRRYKLLDEVSS